MPSAKIAITLETATLKRLDRLVKQRTYSSRSRAIQEAIEEKLKKIDRGRLAHACTFLDPEFETALAEEGYLCEPGNTA